MESTEWNLRPLRIILWVAPIVLAVAMIFPPTRYRRTTWSGFPARVDRFTRLTHQEQVRLRWTLAPGCDEVLARRLCTTCHGEQKMDLTKEHLHAVWVKPGLKAEPEEVPDALWRALATRSPQFEGWRAADLRAPPGEGPILTLQPTGP
jgi:hypothetical protein